MTAERLPSPSEVRIGTRGSALALAQARLVAAALGGLGRPHRLVTIETEGDRRAPDTAWGEGAFVKSIEAALLDGHIDLAVHSAKDVPTDEDPRLVICAYLEREEPGDALVLAASAADATRRPDDDPVNGAALDRLAPGSIVGTDSPRRTGFLRAARPDLDVRPLHGNVDTRLRRLDEGEVDALVLAVAGLVRLGRAERINQRLDGELLPPAPGQGAIALQARADDEAMLALGAAIDHQPTRLAVAAERAFLTASGGGCRAPIGALARLADGRLELRGGYTTLDGSVCLVEVTDGPANEGPAIARGLAERMTRRRADSLRGPRILLTRPAPASRRLAARLAEYGLRGVVVPAIEIELAPAGSPLDASVARLEDFSRVVVTSANGAEAIAAAGQRRGVDLARSRWAAVGEVTARRLRLAEARDVWLPARSSGMAIGAELPLDDGRPILLVRGDLADDAPADALRARGARVEEVVAYRTHEAPHASRALLEEALACAEPLAAIMLASPSAARGVLALAGSRRQDVLRVPALCIGATTAGAATAAGFSVLAEARTQNADELAGLAAELLGGQAWRVPA